MEKVKLPKEVAEAIETALNLDGTEPLQLVRDHAITSGFVRSEGQGHLGTIGTLDVDTLIRALYIGYEVEQTPEDKVREYYLVPKEYGAIIQDTIRHTLDLLGIQIKGVNAE